MLRAVELDGRTFTASAQAAPWDFRQVPAFVSNKAVRLIGILLDFSANLTTTAGGSLTFPNAYKLINACFVKAGGFGLNREIYRVADGAMIRDWFMFRMGRIASPDPASIALSTTAARRGSLMIPFRGCEGRWKRPKDFDVPAWALNPGGALSITWGAIADVTNLSAVVSLTVTPTVLYEVDETGDREIPTPWRMSFTPDSNNSVILPSEAMSYLAEFNADRDHSDQTSVNLAGYVENASFAGLAGRWNSDLCADPSTAGTGCLTTAVPEFLPILWPETQAKVIDLPDNLPRMLLVRGSSDSQRYAFEVVLDQRAYAGAGVQAFGLDPAEVEEAGGFRRKFSSKNPEAGDKMDDQRAADARSRMPIKVTR